MGLLLFRCVFLSGLVYMTIRELLLLRGLEVACDEPGSWLLVAFYLTMVAFECLHLWRDLRVDQPGP